jgi:TRAP-type C4-dicarboxylate transport system permease small subunit
VTFIVAVLALVIGGVIGFAWHALGKPGTWDDIRTWVGFAVVVIGIVIALVQLDMQRRQLAGQQSVLEGEVERNKRRDVLLDGQLRELEQRARSLDR